MSDYPRCDLCSTKYETVKHEPGKCPEIYPFARIKAIESKLRSFQSLVRRGIPLMEQDGHIDEDNRFQWTLDAQEALSDE